MHTSETSRILSVEDNPEMHLLLEPMLEPHDVDFTSGVDETLDAIESESFDTLLLGIHLGLGENGPDLLHIVRDRQAEARLLPAGPATGGTVT